MQDIHSSAESIKASLLPARSAGIYKKWLQHSTSWLKSHNINEIDMFLENVLLVYFNELSKQYSPAILWTIFLA
jgi:hypothetical protein